MAQAQKTLEDGGEFRTRKPNSLPDIEEVEEEKRRLADRRRFRRTLGSTICMLTVVAAVSVLASTLFLPVLQVSGSSMEPTLADRDLVLLLNRSRFETGDLIGFYYQNKLLLKRVIAGPGDTIEIDESGNVRVNGDPLEEPYVTDPDLGETDRSYPFQVPDGRYFVMGDNRATSLDSRSTKIGTIETDQIVGKVIFRIWPIRRIAFLK